MNMKIIFIVVFLLGMASCYDDKGMNDIEVSVSTETSYYSLGDKVISKPELTFALGRESQNLAYEWSYDGHVIAHSKD